MAINYKHKRTSTASKRPTAAQLDVGELALNYDTGSGGIFFEDSGGNIIKVGPAEVSGTAPNSTPAGQSGNSLGEMWLDTSTTPATLKVYNGTAWLETNGQASSLDGPVYFTAQANGALALGDIVYISGAAGDIPIVTKAQANSSATMPAFGFAAEAISSGSTGQITTFGSLEGDGSNPLDTSGLTVNDVVYVSAATAGGWTTTKPTGEGSLLQNIGRIQRVNNQNGVIKVGGAGRASATPNLNDGNIFIGNASNQSVTASFGATMLAALATQNVIITPGSAQFGGDVTVANGEEFRMAELTANGTNYIAFNAPDSVTTTATFELPDGDGTSGQVMKTDGSQVLSWADPVPGITSNAGDLTVDRHILPDTNIAYDLGSSTQRFRDIYLSTNSIDLGGTTLSIVSGALEVGSDPVVTSGSPSMTGNLEMTNRGEVRFLEPTGNGTEYVALRAPASISTGSVTYSLPGIDGSNGQVLQTDGTGGMTWANPLLGVTDNSTGSVLTLADATITGGASVDVDLGDTTLFVDASAARVGINTGSPAYVLDATGVSGDWGVISASMAGDSANAVATDTYKARGTGGSPTTVLAADGIGESSHYAHDGTSYVEAFKSITTAVDGDGNAIYDLRTRVSGTLASRLEINSVGDVEVKRNLILNPSSSAPTLTTNGELILEATSNTEVSVKHRGSDGTTRTGQIQLNGGVGTFGICAHASFDASAGGSFNWTTDKIAEGNITSVVRTETGKFTINFDRDFTDGNYTAVCTAGDEDHSGAGSSPRAVNVVSRTAGSMDIVVERTDDAVQDDDGYIAVMVIGTLS